MKVQWKRLAGVVGAVLAIGGLTAVRTDAAVGDNKTFTVDIDATAAGAAPDAFSGDADAPLAITITNTSPSQSLNSADVVVPSPFALVAAPDDAVVGGPVIELRSLNIVPGASRTFAATVDVRTCTPANPTPFAVDAKQSNDFNGTGNDFYLSSSADLQVDAVGSCTLAFVAQPTDAENGARITSAAFTPGGAPVTVSIDDAGGTGRATHASATVALTALNPSVPAPGLAGTTAVAAVAGLATFSPGPTLAVSAFDYALQASSTGLTSPPPSSTFVIVDDQVLCPSGQSCTAPATASRNGQTVSATFGTGSTGVNLLVSLGAADAPSFACAGYPKAPGTLVSQFVFTGGDGGDRTGTMSVVIPSASRPLNSFEACWAAPYQFLTEAGAPAEVQGTKPGTSDPLYVGLLPDCARRGAPTAPCVRSRVFNRLAGTVTVSVFATGDDPWRY